MLFEIIRGICGVLVLIFLVWLLFKPPSKKRVSEDIGAQVYRFLGAFARGYKPEILRVSRTSRNGVDFITLMRPLDLRDNSCAIIAAEISLDAVAITARNRSGQPDFRMVTSPDQEKTIMGILEDIRERYVQLNKIPDQGLAVPTAIKVLR